MVEKHATREANAKDEECARWKALVEKDRQQGLDRIETYGLKGATEKIMRPVLSQPNTRIIATTLSCAASEIPGLGFKPDVLVCDESGQCLEGDHMIGMTLTSLKAVILMGDPDQLPPTIISQSKGNEYANYLGRSLLSRLCDAGDPSFRPTVKNVWHFSETFGCVL